MSGNDLSGTYKHNDVEKRSSLPGPTLQAKFRRICYIA
jgi:hypothetical protein